ncbi:hypothetical protein CMI48_01830 [Candidatus Pacearchaeota archaeon]|nr:hypothetical protein [Candidatus Pacearchaeota archaeon]|tara:strand:- start:81 stop:467 length:387 start_codon:yes stop_codon:yes gene_type:complete
MTPQQSEQGEIVSIGAGTTNHQVRDLHEGDTLIALTRGKNDGRTYAIYQGVEEINWDTEKQAGEGKLSIREYESISDSDSIEGVIHMIDGVKRLSLLNYSELQVVGSKKEEQEKRRRAEFLDWAVTKG